MVHGSCGCAHIAGKAPCEFRGGVALYNLGAVPVSCDKGGSLVEPAPNINPYGCANHGQTVIVTSRPIRRVLT